MNHEPHTQNLRSLLATQVSDEETTGHRDVVDDAMAWGDRRRRRDRMLTTAGAAVAVVALGAGAATFGTSGSGSGGSATRPAASGGLSGGLSATPSGQAGGGAAAGCTVPNVGGRFTDATLCGLVSQLGSVSARFSAGTLPIVNAHLPHGVTAAAASGYEGPYMVLTGSQGTNYVTLDLYVQPDAPKILPPCTKSRTTKDPCPRTSVSGGEAETDIAAAGDGSGPARNQLFWIPGSSDNYQINLQVWGKTPKSSGTATPPVPAEPSTLASALAGTKALPEPTASTLYLDSTVMTAIIADPAFQELSGKSYRDAIAVWSQIVARETALGITNPGMSPTPSAPAS